MSVYNNRWISTANLVRGVREGMLRECEERERLQKAAFEFYKRTEKATTKEKIKIMKETATKYRFNEQYFLSQISF